MKKYLLLTFCCLGAFTVQAQSRAGLRLAPSLSFNRVVSQSDTLISSTAGTGGRISFGPILDFPLGTTDNYFTTGLIYNPQRVGLKIRNAESGVTEREVYRLQYLQIPSTFTFLTDEIALDKKLYFEVGTLFGLKISENTKHPDQVLIRRFNRFNLSTVLAAGVEMAMGTSTTMSLGMSYQRGLGNVVDRQMPSDSNFSIKNDQLSLDFTVRF